MGRIDTRKLILGQRVTIPKDYLRKGKSDGHEMRKGTVVGLHYRWFRTTKEELHATLYLDKSLFGEIIMVIVTDTIEEQT